MDSSAAPANDSAPSNSMPKLPRQAIVPGGSAPRRTVRGKLMRLVLGTTAIAVGVAVIAMLAYDLSVYRGSWATDLANQASILAVSVAPALEFDDRQVALRNLGAMRVRPRVLVAALYTSDGALYASYSRDPKYPPPTGPPPLGERIAGESVELSQAVTHDGEALGTLYLLARYDVLTRLKAYASIFALVMALSLVVAYLASRWLQRAITGPLDAMTGVAQQIVSRRDYSLRARKTTDDEIGIVVLAFNAMLDEVEARAQASEAANAALAVSNGALQAEIQVRQAAEAALLEADRRKDEFLATLAHELRNPLAPIRHAVKLLKSKGADERQQHWGRAVIGRQVQRMAVLLDDLLDVSRITRGRLSLKIDLVELQTVVEEALEVARPLIEAKGHTLIVDLPPERLMLSVDQLRLSQALSNLLTNAAKYTDDNGRITLAVKLSASEISFAVRDTGIGLDPQVIPHLFQIFSQLDSAIDRAEGGLGIGLALVKGLAVLHGGRVEVGSAGVGQGSEFTIHLPSSVVSAEVEPPAPSADGREQAGDRKCRVLMADDNRDAVDSMSLVLELAGYDVMVAYTGGQALEMAEHRQPDAVLLDIGMPDMTGYQVAEEIRRQDWGRDLFLVAITGWGQIEDKDRARAAGFDHHFTKPVDLDKVDALLRDVPRQRS